MILLYPVSKEDQNHTGLKNFEWIKDYNCIKDRQAIN